MKTPLEFLPDRTVKVPLSWLISGAIVLGSLSVGYGGYKAASENQSTEISSAKQEIASLHKDLADVRAEMASLRTSIDDLKEVFRKAR